MGQGVVWQVGGSNAILADVEPAVSESERVHLVVERPRGIPGQGAGGSVFRSSSEATY